MTRFEIALNVEVPEVTKEEFPIFNRFQKWDGRQLVGA